jgi:PTH1 family peptidyl-tRNA hydrolase
MDWLIAGLGNPGPRYAETRHNAGKMALEKLAGRHGIRLDTAKFDARFGSGRIAGQRVCLASTLVYMNESGRAIVPLSRFYRIPPERILVVYDELDLPFGQLRLKIGGGAGGHNGIRSMLRLLGTEDFGRLRMGIGRPPAGWKGADYVLSRFESAEQDALDAFIDQAADSIEDVLARGLDLAMNDCNRRGD